MSFDDLTQIEADALMVKRKSRVGDGRYIFPNSGGRLKIPLKSLDSNQEFVLHVYRGRLELKKSTYQLQTKTVIILARVDLVGALHRNPDGVEISCPHIHLYREGYNDKWAMPLPSSFSNPEDHWQTFEEFLNFCNVVNKPDIERGSVI